MKISSRVSFAAIVGRTAALFVVLAVKSGAASAGGADPDVAITSALRDAILLDPATGRRHLEDYTVCLDEANALSACVADSVEADCANCMANAFQVANTAVTSSARDCSTLAPYVCAPFKSCPCLSSCPSQYNAVANCMADALGSSAGLSGTCNLNCGSVANSGAYERAGSATMYAAAAASAAAGLLAQAYA